MTDLGWSVASRARLADSGECAPRADGRPIRVSPCGPIGSHPVTHVGTH